MHNPDGWDLKIDEDVNVNIDYLDAKTELIEYIKRTYKPTIQYVEWLCIVALVVLLFSLLGFIRERCVAKPRKGEE